MRVRHSHASRWCILGCAVGLISLGCAEERTKIRVTDRSPGLLVAKLGGSYRWMLDTRGNVHLDPPPSDQMRRGSLTTDEIRWDIRSSVSSPYAVTGRDLRRVRQMVEVARQEMATWNVIDCREQSYGNFRSYWGDPAYVAFVWKPGTGRYYSFPLYPRCGVPPAERYGPATRKLVLWMFDIGCWFEPQEAGVSSDCDDPYRERRRRPHF